MGNLLKGKTSKLHKLLLKMKNEGELLQFTEKSDPQIVRRRVSYVNSLFKKQGITDKPMFSVKYLRAGKIFIIKKNYKGVLK